MLCGSGVESQKCIWHPDWNATMSGCSIVICCRIILWLSLQNKLLYFRQPFMTLCRREFAKGGASGTGIMISLFLVSLAVPLQFSQKCQTILFLKQCKGLFEKFEKTSTENSKCSLRWESILLAPLVEARSHIEGPPTLSLAPARPIGE